MQCPHCLEQMNRQARVCSHCGRDVPMAGRGSGWNVPGCIGLGCFLLILAFFGFWILTIFLKGFLG